MKINRSLYILLVFFLILSPEISLAQTPETKYCEPAALTECQRICTAGGYVITATQAVYSRTDNLMGFNVTCSGPFSGTLPGLGYVPPPPPPPPQTQAGEFTPLVGIPGIENPDVNFNKYINTLYAISISLAALLAVIKIIVAGVKWMLTDVVTSKQEAKKDIQGALIGLLIVISAVLILTVINPNLVNFDILPESETTP